MKQQLSQLYFDNPWAFALLLIPILMLLWHYIGASRFKTTQVVSSIGGIPLHMKSTKLRIQKCLPFIYAFSALFLVIAIARPKGNTEGISIVLATDISGSMSANDLKPNRLVAALNVADKFIVSRPYDRIGLVVFKAEAYTQCPITTDHDALLEQLAKLKPEILTDGTAIGLGLGTAVARLKESKSKSKVIVLLTDGASNSGFLKPEAAAEMAAQEGIRVYTIAIGTKGSYSENFDPTTGMINRIKTDFDESLLKKIAETTRGKYYNATDNKTLQDVFTSIDVLEKNIIRDDKLSKKEERFHLFAIISFVLFIIGFVLQHTYLKSIS